MSRETDPYENLANAIIEQAAKDYRSSVRTLRRSPTAWSAKHMITEVEAFFRSDWFKELTNADGEYILMKLRKEAGIADQEK